MNYTDTEIKADIVRIMDKDISLDIRIGNIFRAIESEIIRDEVGKKKLDAGEIKRLRTCVTQAHEIESIYENQWKKLLEKKQEILRALDHVNAHSLYDKANNDLEIMIKDIKEYVEELGKITHAEENPKIDLNMDKSVFRMVREMTENLIHDYNEYVNANEDVIRIFRQIKLVEQRLN